MAKDLRGQSRDFTWAKGDKAFIRETGRTLQTDDKTKFWKAGKPARFADIKVGHKLRAKTRGTRKGRGRIAWHVFLDVESLLNFQEEQKAAHAKTMATEGLPGYVDLIAENGLELTLFQAAGILAEHLKTGQKIRVAAAGVNRKSHGKQMDVDVVSCQRNGKLYKLKLKTNAKPDGFKVTGLARVWVKTK